jgi:glucans biosynthesis protein C
MSSATRYHSLDALRAGALLLGIVLHATMSFLPGFGDVGWPIVDASPSTTLAVVYFVIHIFRMALFFLIAGFFARLLVVRLGPSGFCKQRLRRIGLPLLAAMVVILPLSLVPLVLVVRSHSAPGSGAAAMLRPEGGIAWGHLWFLYLLLLFDAALVVVRFALLRADGAGRLRALVDRLMYWLVRYRLLPIAFAVPLGLTFYLVAEWTPWDGIPAPIAGFVPNFTAVLAFGSAMFMGWQLHRQPWLLELLALDWARYLGGAVATTTICCVLIGPESQFKVVAMAPAVRCGYAASYALAVWCWCLGLTGLAVAFRSRENPRWRYLADAAYFLYLTHVPLVWGLQAWMMDWPLPWALKFPLLLAITLAVLLLLYRYLVRDTFVGRFLSGRRYPAPGQVLVVPARGIPD